MAVLIRQTPYSDSSVSETFPTNPDNVRADIIIIGSGGDTTNIEGEVGEEDEDADYIRVTYNIDISTIDTATAAGKVKERLKSLVDSSTLHLVNGVGPVFVWADGYMLDAQPAITSGHTVTYDTTQCNGEGRWVHNEDGDEVCTTAAQMLYHEFGHSILNHGDPFHPEADVIIIENELREAMGFELRSTTDLAGGCGCSSECCIVVTVTSGSELSTPVRSLRRVRDHLLRRSRLGEQFFDALHREYYRFSVAIARILARSSHARDTVGQWLVEPLVVALQVPLAWLSNPDEPAVIGRTLFERISDHGPDAPLWSEARYVIETLSRGERPTLGPREDPDLIEVIELLAENLPHSPYVLWGIVEPLKIVLEGRARFSQEQVPQAGAWISEQVESWLHRIPLDVITGIETPAALAQDLAIWAGQHGGWQPIRKRLADIIREELTQHDPTPTGGTA